jgi:hypothetical protein
MSTPSTLLKAALLLLVLTLITVAGCQKSDSDQTADATGKLVTVSVPGMT